MTTREQLLYWRDMHLNRAAALERGLPELPEVTPQRHREYAGHYDRWVAELDRLKNVVAQAQKVVESGSLSEGGVLVDIGEATDLQILLARLNEGSP